MAPPCGRGRARALQRTKQHSSAYAIHTPIPKCRSQTGRLYQQPRRTSSPHPRPPAPLRLQRRPGPHARAPLAHPADHTQIRAIRRLTQHDARHPDRQFRCVRPTQVQAAVAQLLISAGMRYSQLHASQSRHPRPARRIIHRRARRTLSAASSALSRTPTHPSISLRQNGHLRRTREETPVVSVPTKLLGSCRASPVFARIIPWFLAAFKSHKGRRARDALYCTCAVVLM